MSVSCFFFPHGIFGRIHICEGMHIAPANPFQTGGIKLHQTLVFKTVSLTLLFRLIYKIVATSFSVFHCVNVT